MQIRTTSDPIVPANYGHSIKSKRPNGYDAKKFPPPKEVYLIYITLTDNRLTVKHMKGALDGMEVAELEEKLFDYAANPTNETPKPHGYSFKNLKWTDPCYLTLVLDLEGWNFHWGSTEGDDPMIFRRSKPGISKRYHANHSFYNAEAVTIAGRPALRCMNYMKRNAWGHDLKGDDNIRDYSIDINVLTPFSDVDAKPIKVIIDPDGQNQGPPNLPPTE